MKARISRTWMSHPIFLRLLPPSKPRLVRYAEFKRRWEWQVRIAVVALDWASTIVQLLLTVSIGEMEIAFR